MHQWLAQLHSAASSAGTQWLLQVLAGVVTAAVIAMVHGIFKLVRRVGELVDHQDEMRGIISGLLASVEELQSTVGAVARRPPVLPPPRRRPR